MCPASRSPCKTKLTKAKGYGLANVELNVPATEHTVYQWASVTKQFTAAAILMLADDGKLALDDHQPLLHQCARNLGNVTVRHLLTHLGSRATSLPVF
jgi:CubicO group peptidase (beta-lactamase class C family)